MHDPGRPEALMADILAFVLAADGAPADRAHADAVDVVALVRDTPVVKATNNCRGQTAAAAHALLMRTRKAIKFAREATRPKEHMEAALNVYNQKHAKHVADVVDVQHGTVPKVVGRGQYKRWTPGAILRVCFGSARRSTTRAALRFAASAMAVV